MPSLKERVTTPVRRVRDRHSVVDHTLNTVTHYGSVNGNAQAGAVTYFGFLSFFPILALGFFFVGLLARTFPSCGAAIVAEVENLLPGVVGSEEGRDPAEGLRGLRRHGRSARSDRSALRGTRLAVGDAGGPRGDVRAAEQGAPELRRGQGARPRHAGAHRAGAPGVGRPVRTRVGLLGADPRVARSRPERPGAVLRALGDRPRARHRRVDRAAARDVPAAGPAARAAPLAARRGGPRGVRLRGAQECRRLPDLAHQGDSPPSRRSGSR